MGNSPSAATYGSAHFAPMHAREEMYHRAAAYAYVIGR